MRRVLIIGASGQDGRLLTQYLQERGDEVLGVGRDDLDITNRAEVRKLVKSTQPDELYHLAAHQHSAEDKQDDEGVLFQTSLQVNVYALVNVLEGIRTESPGTKLFFPASSHIFGRPAVTPQDEKTPLNPTCIYGITKTSAVHSCRYYRERHGLHASVGIMFNHESPYRKPGFVSRKIIEGVAGIASGKQKELILGDLSAGIDWGYAPDYVAAMAQILSLPHADDFVVASGETHTIREFVEIAFGLAGLDWKQHVVENPALITKQRRLLIGDSSKLRAATGWKPSVDFAQLVKILLDSQCHAK